MSKEIENLEKKVDKQGVKIDEILINHLPHIEQGITKNSTDISWVTKIVWAVFIVLLATFVGVIYTIFG